MFGAYGILQFLTGLAGLALALVIAGAVIWFIRPHLTRVLQLLVGDKSVAEAGTAFVLVLLGLYGLRAALGFISQAQLSRLFSGLMEMLLNMAGVVQWVVYIAALLFIGYSLQARLGAGKKEE